MIITNKYRYSLNKRQLEKWLKENGYTYKDLAEELGMKSRVLKYAVIKKWSFTNDKIVKLINFAGAETAFKIINFKDKEEKDRVFYEAFVKPIEECMGYKWQRKG